MNRMKLRNIAVIAVLVSFALPGARVHAEDIPTLDEVRSAIDKNARAIADGKKTGFGYTVSRHMSTYVPSENLPDRITRFESEIENQREIFLRKGDLRALATYTRTKNPQIYTNYVSSWNGSALRTYEPLQQFGHVKLGIDRDISIDDYFARRRGPFTLGLLPIGIETDGSCLNGQYSFPTDLRQLLKKERVKILSEIETLDDSKCVVLADDTGPFLWLDMNRNFAVKQFIEQVYNLPGVDRFLYFNESFTQVADDLWVIERGFMQFRGPGIDWTHHTAQDILAQIGYRYSDIHFNESIDDTVFDFEFPPGTSVADETIPSDDKFRRVTSTVQGFLPNTQQPE